MSRVYFIKHIKLLNLCAKTRAKGIQRYIERNRFTTIGLLSCLGYGLYWYNSRRVKTDMAKKLETGTNPLETKRKFDCKIERPDVVKSIRGLFESDADGGKIGIVLGPTGSGKTQATMEACSKPQSPNYILYKEIYMNSRVAEQLAHVAGIPLTDS